VILQADGAPAFPWARAWNDPVNRAMAFGDNDMGEVHRLVTSETGFGLQAAGRLMTKIFAPWIQDLALLVESVEPIRPSGAMPDWQPGAVLPYRFRKEFAATETPFAAKP
jgi:hypothetical protein